MDEKARLKLDKVFMAFGSQMHALERNAGGKEWQEYREDAWMWSIAKVFALVEELDRMSGKAETPQATAQEPLGQTDTITVKGVVVHKEGVSKNGPWKSYRITDTTDTSYFTFHSSFRLGETYEIDWKWQGDEERKYRNILTTPRPVKQVTGRADYDDSDDVPF
jgi:hypothetical protein